VKRTKNLFLDGYHLGLVLNRSLYGHYTGD